MGAMLGPCVYLLMSSHVVLSCKRAITMNARKPFDAIRIMCLNMLKQVMASLRPMRAYWTYIFLCVFWFIRYLTYYAGGNVAIWCAALRIKRRFERCNIAVVIFTTTAQGFRVVVINTP
ncbi:hypothetical protein J3Q64DRAFT_1716575 [Phycomyces blakesleeanus]|uniref:Secreted protein n=1 Tax=Phycomyces blakesleeanus TaxID=4837 RepID=A0ABR3BI67_PHYBL